MSRVEKKQPEYGSDVIVDMMKAHDIEYTAFNPGATFRGIHDSIVNYGGNYKPEVIFCHHEEISVAIAHGYAKAKNKPMIAIVPQHGRFAACQHGDFQRLHRPRADDGARRHRARWSPNGAGRASTGSTPRWFKAIRCATTPSGTISRIRWPTCRIRSFAATASPPPIRPRRCTSTTMPTFKKTRSRRWSTCRM